MSLELTRSDIGFGRVMIDDSGVTRRGVIGSDSIAWDDIRDYRLTLEIDNHSALYGLLLGVEIGAVVALIDALRAGTDVVPAFKLGIELVGESSRVDFNWRFNDVGLAISEILEHIDDRLTAVDRKIFAAERVLVAGPLALTADSVRWGKHDPLAKDDVEWIELFDNSPVELRVMAHGRAFPYGHDVTSEIPRLGSVLAIAHELGYPVRGLDLFRALRRQPLPAARPG